MLTWLLIASSLARPEDKLRYEDEIEKLRLTDEQRRAILVKAGMR